MTELHGLQSSIEEFRARGVEVVAISPDSVEQNRDVAERQQIEFTILSDSDLAVTETFGLVHAGGGPGGGDIPRPASFLIVDGEIRWRELTDNWRVRPRPHEILAVVDSLD